jgi:periplasmic mercuric ion binding protein
MTNNKATRIITVFTVLAIFFAGSLATFAKNEVQEVKIKTSATCEHCKGKIEKLLHQTKGVQEADLSLDDKVVTVKYNPAKTSPEKLRKSIAKLGYDADDVKAVKSHQCEDKCKDKESKSDCHK